MMKGKGERGEEAKREKKKGTKRNRKKVKRKRPGRRKQRNTHTHEKEMGEEERKGRGVGRWVVRRKQVRGKGRKETGEREGEQKKQREITRLTGWKKRKRGKQRKGKRNRREKDVGKDWGERKTWAKERGKKNWRSLLGFPHWLQGSGVSRWNQNPGCALLCRSTAPFSDCSCRRQPCCWGALASPEAEPGPPERLGAHLPELILHFMLPSPSDWLWQLAQPWLPVEGMMWAPADTISPDLMGIYADCYHDSDFSNEVSHPGAQCSAAGIPPPAFPQWHPFPSFLWDFPSFPPRFSARLFQPGFRGGEREWFL